MWESAGLTSAIWRHATIIKHEIFTIIPHGCVEELHFRLGRCVAGDETLDRCKSFKRALLMSSMPYYIAL